MMADAEDGHHDTPLPHGHPLDGIITRFGQDFVDLVADAEPIRVDRVILIIEQCLNGAHFPFQFMENERWIVVQEHPFPVKSLVHWLYTGRFWPSETISIISLIRIFLLACRWSIPRAQRECIATLKKVKIPSLEDGYRAWKLVRNYEMRWLLLRKLTVNFNHDRALKFIKNKRWQGKQFDLDFCIEIYKSTTNQIDCSLSENLEALQCTCCAQVLVPVS